jgi:nucleotide-binding universal stress UspA family protein
MTVNGATEGVGTESTTRDVVVVGFDASPGARVAAEYALEEAALRGGELRIVAVEARMGIAWHQLTEAAKGAALLVLGHRGRGAIASAMMGSVGLQSVLHARVPVTIVRPEAG